jgi:hypothetical protein
VRRRPIEPPHPHLLRRAPRRPCLLQLAPPPSSTSLSSLHAPRANMRAARANANEEREYGVLHAGKATTVFLCSETTEDATVVHQLFFSFTGWD